MQARLDVCRLLSQGSVGLSRSPLGTAQLSSVRRRCCRLYYFLDGDVDGVPVLVLLRVVVGDGVVGMGLAMNSSDLHIFLVILFLSQSILI